MRTVATPARRSGRRLEYSSPTEASLPDMGGRGVGGPTNPKANGNETGPNIGFILDSLNTCYLKVDRNYVIVEANAHALSWLRLPLRAVVGRGYSEVFRGSPQHMLQSAVESTVFTDRELRSHDRPDRWVELHAHPVRDGAIVFFKDISERKKLERHASHMKVLLERTLDTLSAHVVVLDKTGTIVASNLAWRRFAQAHGLAGPAPDRPLNYLALHAAPLASCPEAKQIADLLASLLGGRRRAARHVYAWQCAGETLWFQLSAAGFESEGETYLVVVNEDVTAVKEARSMLGEAAERASILKSEERRRIAEELHDSTVQHVVAAGLNLMSLKSRLAADRRSRDLVGEIDASLEAAMKELRTITYLLHPPDLDQDGLRATLASYVHGFDNRTGLKTRLRVSEAVDALPSTLQRTFLRIVQDMLADVHRHASATRVCIDVRCMLRRLHLVVSDDGRSTMRAAAASRGKQAPRGKSGRGAGIPGIRARLRRLDGELRVESGPRGGTTLHAMVPMQAPPMARR
jgi:two-component system, NarL family, sensor kinase